MFPCGYRNRVKLLVLATSMYVYSCHATCLTHREFEIFNSRDCIKKTFESGGLEGVGALALSNARDLVPLLLWNEAHGIRLFRLSSCIFPWMTFYQMEDLPQWPEVQQVGAIACFTVLWQAHNVHCCRGGCELCGRLDS